jgi:membrane dipeptidase
MRQAIGIAAVSLLLTSCGVNEDASEQATSGRSEAAHEAEADRLAHEILILDGHIDLPWRLRNSQEDVTKRTTSGHFDYPRAREGGLDAAFMAIFVPASYEESGGAKQEADELIDRVEDLAAQHPDKFALATSAAEIEAAFAAGKIALPMGMENGAPVEGRLDNLRHFHRRGVRYITLAHAEDNHICDANFDDTHTWGGLSPFGREVVAEMNRLGMMIDVSHVSDQAFWHVMELSQAPAIASHSSCRHFTPGWERNMSDEMIRRLADSGGVIQINFGSMFLNDEVRQRATQTWEHFSRYKEEHDLDWSDESFKDYRRRYRAEHPIGRVELGEVADHIDHVVSLVGVDHVGLGSDFDGVSSLPAGLEDVSGYPNLVGELLRRGYSEEDIRKICSGNVLRVMREVERVARELGVRP